MPCNVMADEILTPGEGRIRALFVLGGNPMVAFPNQQKVARALADLELLVAIDPWMSATAKRAHYILPPVLQLERADATLLGELYFEEAYAHYTEAVLPRAPELIEEWEFYVALAARMGLPLAVNGSALPTDGSLDKHTLTALLTQGSRIPLEQVRETTAGRGGALFPEARQVVAAADPRNATRFRMLPPEIAASLRRLAAEPLHADGRPAHIRAAGATHLLSSRRIRQFFNSTGHNFERLRDKGRTNHAYMHPSDLAALGLASDDTVEITADTGRIVGVVMAAEDIRPGVVSMAHAFGDTDSDAGNVREQGSSTNALVSDERYVDPITGQARQSAIPVRIRRIDAAP
jgi:anaerobic selenocysteine-containing dehydrogenase